MSLPVSQYEALLAEVRGLRQTAQRVQQLARPLLQGTSNPSSGVAFHRREFGSPSEEISPSTHLNNDGSTEPLDYTMESLLLDRRNSNGGSKNYDQGVASSNDGEATCSDEDYGSTHRCSTKMSVSSEPTPPRTRAVSTLYHGTWPVEKGTMWNSEPTSIGAVGPSSSHSIRSTMTNRMEVNSVMSFASSSGGVPLDRVLGSPEHNKWSSQQLEAKMDVVHSLLAMLGCQEHVNMGETLLALSTCPESCLAMRQSGCIPLLVQLVQSDRDSDTRKKASQALHNLVNSQPDEKLRKRESKVLKLLEQCSAYTEALRNNTVYELPDMSSTSEDGDKHPVQTVAHLMKLSFDEGHRQAICQLGGIHTIASLVEIEHSMHNSISTESQCILMRRYACMALTNLTFGDSGNKALLCSFREFMRALVVQLQSGSDELRQVTASVLRNLSWRADSTSKGILREVGSVTGLMKVAMLDNKENTLKSILSALWNLSAHCTENKSEICAVDGALGFLVDMLTYKTPSKSLAIIENSGGILRNISSQIAVREDYRETLRNHNCLQILLEQLKSPSLTIVSNACGTLWNLSAISTIDQETLWQMGAPAMLRSLNHSKHKMISMGSSAALKNLLNARPQQALLPQIDSTALALDLPALPTLGARKQKALMQDLDQNLTETYENIEKYSPLKENGKDDGIMDFIQDSRHKSKERASNLEYVDEVNLSTNFASLNLNEPSTSYSNNIRTKSRIPQNYNSSSLPYMSPSVKRTNPCTYIPVRNKFSDCGYEDEIEISDQPIDYSQKYAEMKLPNNEVNDLSSSSDRDYSFGNPKPETENFGIYAETDLDQPTDYSLRYAEDDSDSEICAEITKNEPQEYVQDTVKTYCTEGTPYETPFNFSTATSMSDLRLDEKPVIDNDKLKDNETKNSKKVSENIEEKDHCSTEDISETDPRPKLNKKPSKSELSSGLMSPEKPVNYCEEGTPGYFSRVSSFGSLTSIPANDPIKIAQKQTEDNLPLAPENITLNKRVEKTSPKTPSEAKAVKFERVVNYAEETPLMFSRSSSLASLDSIEQHSIHDDRSSVVSDFSRLTSGIVSPSELPDSPTQTVPPSPKPRKASIDFPSSSKSRIPSDGRTQRVVRSIPKPSVFEDNITKFKEESTPIQFSTATSLSSLTIDDQTDQKEKSCIPPDNSVEGNVEVEKEEEVEKKDAEKDTNISDGNDEFVPESEDDGDEDILAACISIGMQNSSAEQSKLPATSTPTSKLPRSSYKFGPRTSLNSSSIPLARNSSRVIRQPVTDHRSSDDVSEYKQDRESGTPNHVLQGYSVEESPALLSCAGSNSDLSLLSVCNDNKGGRKGDYLSDESSSNLSGDNDNILAECIQSGMPKASKNNPKSTLETPASCLPCRNVQTVVSKYNNSLLGNGNLRGNETNKVSDVNRRDNSLPPYFSARDEVASYAVENSPCHFSLRSSLSDLTVDGSVAGVKSAAVPHNHQESSTDRQSSGLSAPQPVNKKVQEQNASRTEQLSRRDSLSSISVESLGSLEAEQALLEQCISSGKPKSKSVSPTKALEIPDVRLHLRKMGKPQSRILPDAVLLQPEDELESRSKNVSAASVAGSTTLSVNEEVCPDMPPAAAGVGENQEPGTKMIENQELCREELEKTEILMGDTSLGRCSLTEETLLTGLMKSGSKKPLSNFENLEIEDCLARSCENSKHVDNRMLDPDAMIESLDRFTAELVSQASHLNKDDEKYKMSTGDNTWNEDTSPAEVTFPSISGSAPNVITFSNEEDSCKLEDEIVQQGDVVDGDNKPSNDFTSINTSTMTDSTLIALEASKMATVFKNEAEMSISVTSAASLELDHVQPPSNLNSLTNSAIGLEKIIPSSPKLIKKKILSAGFMVRKALSNSLNHGSSLESLENRSLSNLDHINPPSDLLYDMEGSMTSIASLPCENDQKMEFVVNGTIRKDPSNISHPIFSVRQPFMGSNFSSHELENINPPSLFNEITEFCNSLADVPSELIGSETEVFEDCYTHIADTLQDDITLAEDVTEFSDAQSGTPLQSELSSAESTPKRTKNLSKSMTSKQRRNLLRDRYKTYTVAAEMVMREEEAKCKENNENCEDITLNQEHVEQSESTTYVSPTYSVVQPKLTPKEKRQTNRFRFETQVLDQAITKLIQQPVIEAPPPEQIDINELSSCSTSPAQSPARTKLSIRNSFMQKRLENKDRFKTQTLSESSFSPDISSSPTPENSANHMQWNLKKEADLVLKSLHDTKVTQNEFIDCETLSLVSNDDDSEHNSGGSMNYRTYHKSWGVRKINMPVVISQPEHSLNHNLDDEIHSVSEEENDEIIIGKPKIVKPSDIVVLEDTLNEEQVKGVRGRRKPLYSKSNINNKVAPKNIKPAKTMTSNLVKNVTASLKSGTSLKSVASKQIKTFTSRQHSTPNSRISSGYGSRPVSNTTSPKISPARVSSYKTSAKQTPGSGTGSACNSPKGTPPMERQGTFTKDDASPSGIPKPPSSKIPTATSSTKIASKIARSILPSTSKIPSNNIGKPPPSRNGATKSFSSDRANKNIRIYNRSTSADSREPARKIQSSPSTQSLKCEGNTQNGALKKSAIPSLAQRSASNSSLNSNGLSTSKKQVTSKIASLWKKIENTKKQPPKKDTRQWIQPEREPRLIRSNTFDNKDGVIMRNQPSLINGDETKRISRLGSFVMVDDNEEGIRLHEATDAATV